MFDGKGKARNSRVAVLNVRAARWASVSSERMCRCENSGLGVLGVLGAGVLGRVGWGALVPTVLYPDFLD